MLESFSGVIERWIWNKAEGRHKRSRDAMLSEPWERALKGQRADIRNTKFCNAYLSFAHVLLCHALKASLDRPRQ